MGKLVKFSVTLVTTIFLIALIGCDEPTDTPKASHSHEWSDWKHDTTKHWKECSCGAKTEEGNHAFENNKCKTCGYDKTIAVESISLDVGAAFNLAVGGTKILTPSVKPDTATNKTVTWTSSDNRVAKVENGKVTALKAGTAKITAEAGGKKIECTVTVTAPTPAQPTHQHVFEGSWKSDPEKHWKECTAEGCGDPKEIKDRAAHTYDEASETPNKCTVCNYVRTVDVESVTLAPTTLSLKVGVTEKLIATVTPSNATTKVVTWDSKDKTIAKVDTNGSVEAVGVGSTEIIATAGDRTAKCTVSVEEADPPVETHVHNNGEDFDGTDDNYHWKQCNNPGCTEEGGKVDKAAHTWVDGKCSICDYNEPIVPVTNIVIEETELRIVKGDAPKTLTFKVEPEDATDQTIDWESSDSEVATVTDGVVTPIRGGKTTIIAKIGVITAACSVTVECDNDEHDNKYTKKDDTEHTVKCSVCEKDLGSEDHEWGNDDVCTKQGCNAHKPLVISNVLGGKESGKPDVSTMTGTNLEAYNANLDKYEFKDFRSTEGGYEVTCEVNVTELQPATDGGAKDRKNIVAILEFNVLKTFAIGNIKSKQSGNALTDTSWVSDAHLFVKDADEENKTYVTLWMSMQQKDDGTLVYPEMAYEIKAYAGDENPKTLTFKFNDKASEVSSFDELKTAVENDYANIKLVENITLPETLVISHNATIDLNGHTIDRGESFEVKHSSDIAAHGSHSSLIYIGEEEPTVLATVTEKGAFKVLITDNSVNRGKIDTGIYGIHAVYAQDDANVTLNNIEVTTSFEKDQAALVRACDATITLNKAKVTAVGAKSDSIMVKTDTVGVVKIIDSEINGKGIGVQNWGTATIQDSTVTANKAIMAISYLGKDSTVTVKGSSTINGGIQYGAVKATDPTPVVAVDSSTSILNGLSLSENATYHAKTENAFDLRINDAADITLAESAIKGDKIENGYLVKALQGCTGVKNSGGKLITVDKAGNVEVSE